MFFMYFIMRAGIQVLADHPRLYWNRDCTPGTEWFRFSRPGADVLQQIGMAGQGA
jgi:methionine sulfoxide reductase catalytic subunit